MKIVPYKGGRWWADAGEIHGKRIRKVFTRKKEAEAWLEKRAKDKEYLQLGISKLSPRDSHEAEAAMDILDGKTTLTSAASYWRDNNAPENAQPLSGHLAIFLEHLRIRDSRPRYLDGMRTTIEGFRKELGDHPLHLYTPEKILDWLRRDEWSKATFANRRRELSVFFNWAVRQGHIRLNPVARIPAPKIDRGKIDVLTPKETRNLMASSMDRQRVYFAIACFAGLRPAEIDRLQWGDIKLGRGIIDVQGKTRDRRPVKIEPNLRKFIEAAKGYSPDDFILRADKSDMMKLAANAIGRESWPQNICRHSFGSYHLEMFGDMNRTALEMGHKTTAMLFSNYRFAVEHEDAVEFWSIMPT